MMNAEIYNEIKKRILFFEYEPGEMLNEKRLAQEFGVSRTPVREVFLKLEWEKLVTIMPRAGIMVTKVDFQQLHDVFHIRLMLATSIGALAAKNITDEHIEKMKALRDDCKSIAETNDYRNLVDIDLKFRDIISTAAGNDPLKELTDSLYNQTQRLWFMVFKKIDFPTLVQEEVEEIEEGIRIFSERDPELAGLYRKRMIEQAMDRIVRIFGY